MKTEKAYDLVISATYQPKMTANCASDAKKQVQKPRYDKFTCLTYLFL